MREQEQGGGGGRDGAGRAGERAQERRGAGLRTSRSSPPHTASQCDPSGMCTCKGEPVPSLIPASSGEASSH